MATGRLESEWDRTAQIVAVMAELKRDSKKRAKPYTAKEFNPYRSNGSQAKAEGSIEDLKVFLPRGRRWRQET